MVGVKNEEQVQGLGHVRVHLIVLGGNSEHHLEEVLRVTELVLGVDEGMADGLLVRVGGDGGELAQQAEDGEVEVLAAGGLARGVLIEGRERADGRGQGRHRMRVAGKAFVEVLHVLVQHRVAGDVRGERLELLLIGQPAVDQKVAGLHEGRMLGELLDGDAAVAQDAFLSIEKSDRAEAGAGVHVAVVERDVPRLGAELGDVDGQLPLAALDDRQFDFFSIQLQNRGLGHVLHHNIFLTTIYDTFLHG